MFYIFFHIIYILYVLHPQSNNQNKDPIPLNEYTHPPNCKTISPLAQQHNLSPIKVDKHPKRRAQNREQRR